MTDGYSAGWRERLEESYGLPADTTVGMRRSGRHTVRVIRAGGRRFVLKAVRERSGTADRLQWELAFQRHLADRDGPASRPVERRDVPGEMRITHPHEGIGALYEYLPGRPCRTTPGDAEAAGRALATLHRLADGCDGAGAPTGGRTHLVDGPVRTIHDHLGRRFPEGLRKLADRLGDWVDRLPKGEGGYGLCHGDSHYENAFIDEAGRVRFFDFEHAVRTWRAYDLATFIWGMFRLDRGVPVWNAFMRGYAAVRPLDETETAWIRPFLVIRQLWWVGFTIEASTPENPMLPVIVDEGLDLAECLAEELDVRAVMEDGEVAV
jgi:Ser/Thr protein kinase RdoA (MazF antagonist)